MAEAAATDTVRMAVPSHRFHWYNGEVFDRFFAGGLPVVTALQTCVGSWPDGAPTNALPTKEHHNENSNCLITAGDRRIALCHR